MAQLVQDQAASILVLAHRLVRHTAVQLDVVHFFGHVVGAV